MPPSLARFRSPSSSNGSERSLLPLEKALLVLLAAILALLTWGGGGMYGWVQIAAGALTLPAFVLALVVRQQARGTFGQNGGSGPWPGLRRFPLFWIGLIYFAFVFVQLANPAWTFIPLERRWRIEPVAAIGWLPHGIAEVPFRLTNAWRVLLIHGTVWMLAGSIWIGLTRRKSHQLLATVIAANGGLVALIMLLQRLTDTPRFLWLWKASTGYFIGPFFYKNHGGAFLVLVLGACLALAWWHARRAARELRKSHPGLLFGFLALLVLIALPFTYARAATALGLLLAFAAGLGYLLAGRGRPGGASRAGTVLITLVGGAFLALCLYFLNTETIWNRFERLLKEDQQGSVAARQLATRATLDMARDQWVFGHGISGFRLLFPLYQQHYPEIYERPATIGQRVVTQRLYWEHAHNDYAELLAEGGVVGLGMLLAALFFLGRAYGRARAWARPEFLLLLAGPLLVGFNALFDFPFHNPAVLATTVALLTLTARWAQWAAR